MGEAQLVCLWKRLPSIPKLGSARCQSWATQYEPSGALQAAITQWSAGPSYVPQLPWNWPALMWKLP